MRGKAIKDHTDWRDVREAYLFSAQLNALFLTAFGLFALAAAALIMTNSISGAVLAQFRDIGVLKALGFTGGQVAGVYLGQNLVMGAVGGVMGIALGVALAPLPLTTLARHSMPRRAWCLIPSCCLAYGLACCWRCWFPRFGLRGTARASIRFRRSPPATSCRAPSRLGWPLWREPCVCPCLS